MTDFETYTSIEHELEHEVQHECGVFGIYAPQPVEAAQIAYYGLYALQHRGQQGCGIVINDDGLFYEHRDLGLISQVFTPEVIGKLPMGQIAVAHTRYSSAKSDHRANCQPIIVQHIKGHTALAHNGKLTNSRELRDELELQGSIFHTTSDTEVISYLITKERLTAPSIEEALNRAMHRLKGSFSLVLMSSSKLVAARDENGIHPLCYGQCTDGTYIVASESCALEACSADFIREIEPDEIVVFSAEGVHSIKDHCNKQPKATCIFEYVYTARPDSQIDGLGVHDSRLRAGACLARRHPADADVVIGVPDSGLDAAIGFARESGIPFEIGFLKNKYIGRTFISPTQAMRQNQVRIKLNPISSAVRGKRVVMVDDSIVRGTTCKRIVSLLRHAGATEVHVRLSSPKFLNPCYYGTDIYSKENLIACKYDTEGIREYIGADSVGYLDLEDLPEIVGVKDCAGFGGSCNGYCCGCFDGVYPTELPKDTGKRPYETKLSEREAKQ